MTTEEPTTIAPISTTPCLSGNFQNRTNVGLDEDCGMYSSTGMCTVLHSACTQNDGSSNIWQCKCTQGYAPKGGSCVRVPGALFTDAYRTQTVSISPTTARTTVFNAIFSEVNGFATTNPQASIIGSEAANFEINSLTNQGFQVETKMKPTQIRYEVTIVVSVQMGNNVIRDHVHIVVNVDLGIIEKSFLVFEGTPPGSVVGFICTSCLQSGAFVLSPTTSDITVNNNGTVTINKDLDFERSPNLLAYSRRYDIKQQGGSTSVIARIKLVFVRRTYISELNEGSTDATIVGQFENLDSPSIENSNEAGFKVSTSSSLVTYLTLGTNRVNASISSKLDKRITVRTGDVIFTTRIFIQVIDVNNNPPIFKQGSYSFTMIQSIYPDLIVGFVKADDKDANTVLTYKIVPDDKLKIDNNGVISIKSPFTNKEENYTATVTAMDEDLAGTANVRFTIIKGTEQNLNHNFTGEINENSNAGAQVANVFVAKHGKYSFTDQAAFRDFRIDDTTGIVTSARPFDREKEQLFKYTVVGNNLDEASCTLVVIGEVTITIKDLNDEIPVFDHSSYNAEVPEGESNTKLKMNVQISAKDKDLNSVITYSVVASHADKFTIANPSTGVIETLTALDRETSATYTVLVRAWDTVNAGTATVTVTVLDKNDNKPQFTNIGTGISVSEGVKTGSNVYTISATDPDEGKNAEITYDLDSVGGFFKMNQTTGEITTLRSLDRETDSSHTIIVYARDNGDTIQSVSETITVTVTDVNDNSPVFSQSEVVVSFNESQACSTSIMTITATDADQPNHQNSQITYSIKSGADKFVIDNTNLLKCVQPFDFETAKSHQVIIIAQDNGTPRRTAEQKVTVQIQDLNDNRPVFQGAPFSTTIRYIAGEWQSGRLVLAVSATDADAGVNGEVTYTISGAAFLQINGKSGVISTTNQPTPSNSQYQLIVTATDGGSSPLSSSTTIAVTIDTITTQPVKFNKQEFNMTIEENKPINTQVESVSSGVIRPIGTSLSFEIVDSDVSKIPLTLTNDGKVQVSKNIDRESKDVYEFIVKVKNTAANDQSDLSLVRVSITDVNDNVPNFDKVGLYTFTISENSNIGASATPDVEDIKASDSDIGDNAVIEFVIEGVSSCTNSFTLKNPGSSNRRLVTLKTQVDYEQVKNCRFFVTAYNPNKREMNSTTDVLVRIRDFNDNEPEFSGATNGVYSIKVPEDTTINSEVIYIGMVTDADDNENGDVELSSDNNCPFKFERDFGEESRRFGLKLKTGVNLDYETGQNNIDCQLTATDKANPPMPRLTSTVTVNIEITDVNDNAPTFNDTDKQIQKQVSRDADVNHTVIDNLPATDLDSGVNGQLIYSLRPSQYSSYFTIRSSDGRLAVNAHLVSVPKDELTLTAIVSDNGIPPRHDELLVQIELLDQNPRPYFLSQEKVSFREHSIRPDGVISKVVAYDRKSGIVQECDCTYYLDTRREDIVIESTTGTIKFLYSNGTLDREKEAGGRVIFGVIAEDKERPPKNSSTMSFVIEIEDINDNSPFFQNQEYSFVFHQNTPDGTVIGTMKAIDRDLDPVTLYSINSTTDTDGRMITDIVQINERTGEITKSGNTTLSSVENAVITGFVTARDGKDDKPPSISLLRIVIEYDDKNNHTPTFERQMYESELDWSSPAKKFILQVNATDDDKDAQGRVHYYIERGNTRGFFDIHNTTGVLTLAYLLDSSIGTGNRETITLKIKAQDGGIIPKYSFADVRIVITGINPGVCVQQAEHSRQLVDLEAERNSWSGALYGLVAALCIAIIACCFLIYKWRTSVSLPEEDTSNTNNKNKNFDHATYSDLSKSQREVEYSQSNQAFDPPSYNIDFESGKDEYTRVDEGLGATSSFRDTLSVDEPKPDYSPYMKQRMKPVMTPEVPSDKSEPASTSFNPMFRS